MSVAQEKTNNMLEKLDRKCCFPYEYSSVMSYHFLRQLTKAAVISAVVLPGLSTPAAAQGSVLGVSHGVEEVSASTSGVAITSLESSALDSLARTAKKKKKIPYGDLF